MRQSRFILSLIILAGLCSAARGQNPPAQKSTPPPATPPQAAPPPATPQQPPSLGDVARKVREEKAAKEKSGAHPGTLYTNEGILPTGGANALGMGPAPNSTQLVGGGSGRGGAGSGTSPEEALAGLENAQAKLDNALVIINSLAEVDRATMVNTILKENNSDFPGRAQWEERLMAGRDYYVRHGRQLILEMKQLLANAKALAISEPNVSENDPRVQMLMRKIREGYSDAQKTADDFKKLVEEGLSLAKQPHQN
jgi:hypothetical protein